MLECEESQDVFGSARTPGPDMLPPNLSYEAKSSSPAVCSNSNFGPHPTQSAFISFRNVADQLLRDGRTTDMPPTRAYAEDLRHPPDGQLCQGPSALTNVKPDDSPSRSGIHTIPLVRVHQTRASTLTTELTNRSSDFTGCCEAQPEHARVYVF